MGRKPWNELIKQQLKQELGLGWTICCHKRSEGYSSERVKLTRRDPEDGSRSSVMLPFEWDSKNGTKILNRVVAIAEQMAAKPQMTLKDAAAINPDVLEAEAGQTGGTIKKGTATAWKTIAHKFLATKSGLRSTSRKEWALRVQRTIDCLEFKPKPRTGQAVLERYKELWFEGATGMEPGGQGRRRNIGDACAFLTWGVERCGAPARYLPPSKEVIQELVGVAVESAQEKLTPALKDDQFTGLLDALLDADRKDLWLCVAILGYTGIRPSELSTLQVKEGEATVAGTKRNSKTMGQSAKRRLIVPLEIEGRGHEGQRALELFESGLVRLPKAVRNQIARVMDASHPNPTDSFQAVGKEVGQQLKRFDHWQNLIAAQPELSMYSLRHAFAFRSTFGANRLPVRAAAKLLGHHVATHYRHYGGWLDQESTREEAQRFNDAVAA